MGCPPQTILDYLIARFPNVDSTIWRQRVSEGLVQLSDGSAIREDSPYRHGIMVFYRRHVTSEAAAAGDVSILYRGSEIIVVDKPHGMPVTPAGEYVERSLLIQLQRSTGLTDLSPAHRLDRETAGLVLLTVSAAERGPYHALFTTAAIEREYLAVAHAMETPRGSRWHVENRIERGDPWYRQRIVDGPVNAVTEVELIEWRSGLGLFRLLPKTGKKHQLRVHMASLGWPIAGDPFYPVVRTPQQGETPLQLLASRLTFIDPKTGTSRTFTSSRKLRW